MSAAPVCSRAFVAATPSRALRGRPGVHTRARRARCRGRLGLRDHGRFGAGRRVDRVDGRGERRRRAAPGVGCRAVARRGHRGDGDGDRRGGGEQRGRGGERRARAAAGSQGGEDVARVGDLRRRGFGERGRVSRPGVADVDVLLGGEEPFQWLLEHVGELLRGLGRAGLVPALVPRLDGLQVAADALGELGLREPLELARDANARSPRSRRCHRLAHLQPCRQTGPSASPGGRVTRTLSVTGSIYRSGEGNCK